MKKDNINKNVKQTNQVDQFSAQLSSEPDFHDINYLLSNVHATDTLEQNVETNNGTKLAKKRPHASAGQQSAAVNAKFEGRQQVSNATAKDNEQSEQTLEQASDVIATIKQTEIDKYDELENYRRLRRRRTRRLVARAFVFALLMVMLPVTIFLCSIVIDRNGNHNFFGYTYYLVVSQSMEPEIMVGDLVVLKKVKDLSTLKIGDDIGYINSDGKVVVHRIVGMDTNYLGETQYYTKGVNDKTNPSQDMLAVEQNQVVGIRVATHHALGQTLTFFRSAVGIVVLVLLIGAVIVGFVFAFKFTEDIRYVPEIKE